MNKNNADKRRRYRCAEACNTCKRRKEKCDGNRPCARCVDRGVHATCHFRHRQSFTDPDDGYSESREGSLTKNFGNLETSVQEQQPQESNYPLTLVASNVSTASVPETSRLIQDTKGKYMFIGDSANLSLLQNIRSLVSASIGPCAFVEDPFRYQMVESAPEGPTTWLHATGRYPPIKPSYNEATYLVRRYTLATNCVLDLFDERDLLSKLPSWLSSQSDQTEVLSAIYYLIFAIGAQTCPEDKDTWANLYFDYGRYLTASYFMEDPSISTVQTYAMITMYMLGASRRNAAFMYLGTAVRAAYALGLHRSDIAKLFTPAEIQTRERLWKVLRVLDLFMSASLGRHPSTEETRDTEQDENYSASNDLCAIFEKILTDVYAKRMITTDTLQKISQHHRRWTVRFHRGLDADRIKDEELLEGQLPNIGLIHVKEAYYWTIILLTRPFFLECISNHIALRSQSPSDADRSSDILESSQQVMVHACVNSAICTVNLVKVLLEYQEIPKRLPFVVNSLFVSGLVLGLSYFGDLYKTYPLDDSLRTALKLLALFPFDAIAKRNLAILELLLDACSTYVRRQAKENMARRAHLVSGIFGQMDHGQQVGSSAITNFSKNRAPHFERHGNGLKPSAALGQTQISATSHQAHTGIDGSSEAATTNTGAESNVPSLDALMNSEVDFLMPPIMSPRTLWFGSYEDNTPLFSTVDTRDFME